jgi:lactate permease
VSALVAAIPIIVLFVMLGALRKPAWMSAVTALLSALVVALVRLRHAGAARVLSTLYGIAYGIFPIAGSCSPRSCCIGSVDTGKFEIIKDSVGGLTQDRRLQAMFIAFSFGAFIEGAAGFGAPSPFRRDARRTRLLAVLRRRHLSARQYAPVAFGSIGIPVTTLAASPGFPCCRSARWWAGCAR